MPLQPLFEAPMIGFLTILREQDVLWQLFEKCFPEPSKFCFTKLLANGRGLKPFTHKRPITSPAISWIVPRYLSQNLMCPNKFLFPFHPFTSNQLPCSISCILWMFLKCVWLLNSAASTVILAIIVLNGRIWHSGVQVSKLGNWPWSTTTTKYGFYLNLTITYLDYFFSWCIVLWNVITIINLCNQHN